MKRTTAALAVATLLLSACQEREAPLMATSATPTADPVPTAPALPGGLTCSIDVKSRTVSCPDVATPAGAGLMASAADERVIGGQGLYVRLASYNVAYDGTTFTFDVTVQNLTTQSMATDDGATPHGDGVMVFLPDDPEVTAGTGTVSVTADDLGTFTGADQPFYRYGGTDGLHLGADGILASGETSTTRTWSFTVPATVQAFTFQAYVATQSANGPLTSIAPQIASFSDDELVPGSSVIITGSNFHATPVSNTVMIGGVAATVTAGNVGSLTVTVPCRPAGATTVQVSHSGLAGVPVSATIDLTPTSLAIGAHTFVSTSGGLFCTELASADDEAEYIVSVFSASTSPSSNAPFEFSGAAPGAAEGPQVTQRATVQGGLARPQLTGRLAQELDEQAFRDARHHEMLELNIRLNEELRARFPRSALAGATTAAAVEPPLTRKFRIFTNNSCAQYYVVSATRVYYSGKVAIYEDDATSADFKASLNATMASNYQNIGDQFNADMEPVIRDYFGDVLLRDAQTDNNGVLVALFTPHINNNLPGVAGFVISCDQYPNDDDTVDPAVGGPYVTVGGTNGASNHGEVFYAYQPAVIGTGYTANTAENWFRTIRSTFIHETKHVASQAARVANGAPFENPWLEEGTARHSEELWGRTKVDNLSWKTNNGYGSAVNPVNIYCDVRPVDFPECTGNPRRPANVMNRHFGSLYTHLASKNARLLSPFGAAPSDNASYWYAISWSLVRYAADRYATSEEAFFTALTDATATGVTNLSTVAGVSIEQLLAEWNLALVVDDYPDLVGADPSTQFATWNLRDIYAGYNADFSGLGSFLQVFPQIPTPFTFGAFTAAAEGTLRGGGALWYQLHGTQSASQLLQLTGIGGAALPSTVRMAVVRVK